MPRAQGQILMNSKQRASAPPSSSHRGQVAEIRARQSGKLMRLDAKRECPKCPSRKRAHAPCACANAGCGSTRHKVGSGFGASVSPPRRCQQYVFLHTSPTHGRNHDHGSAAASHASELPPAIAESARHAHRATCVRWLAARPASARSNVSTSKRIGSARGPGHQT